MTPHAPIPQEIDAEYDREGNLTINWRRETGGELFGVFQACIENIIPGPHRDWDEPDTPNALWVSWQYARTAEALALSFWPRDTVRAAANPHYRPRRVTA